MPKKNIVAIYEHLFKEGVMVAKKDTHAPKHPELESIPNLQVIKTLTSLKSRGYVKEQFAWRHYYWYLTNEGIGYLRQYLHLPPEIVPSTLKRQSRPDARPRPSAGGPPRSFGDKPSDGDRAAYRRAPGHDSDKAGAAGPGSAPMEFVSWFVFLC
jgi:small subunit ribosomal protein S10e